MDRQRRVGLGSEGWEERSGRDSQGVGRGGREKGREGRRENRFILEMEIYMHEVLCLNR